MSKKRKHAKQTGYQKPAESLKTVLERCVLVAMERYPAKDIVEDAIYMCMGLELTEFGAEHDSKNEPELLRLLQGSPFYKQSRDVRKNEKMIIAVALRRLDGLKNTLKERGYV